MYSRTQALYSNVSVDLLPHLPRRYHYLWDAKKVEYLPGMTTRDFAILTLGSTLLKKNQEAISPTAESKALEKFRSVNEDCRNWSLDVTCLLDEVLVGTLKQRLYEFFYPSKPGGPRMPLIPDDLLAIARESDLVGPGSSVGGVGQDFYSKLFCSPLTSTSRGLYEAYRRYIAEACSWWPDAEVLRSATYGDCKIVEANRLTFVPKTHDVSRTICSEPTLNMLFQKGVDQILLRRIRQYLGIDLRVQQMKNRRLARIGSRNGHFVTIDLSSASDSMGNRMLKEMLPSPVYGLLQFLRSPKSLVVKTGELIDLEMVSTMGNGFTFSLQTALFACVVAAANDIMGNRDLILPHGDKLGTYGVNGDDIVCDRNVARGVVRLLTILGFKLNQQKSFLEGPFRESCGGDYLRGVDVRGVYIETLHDQESCYAAINGLNAWSARHNVPMYHSVQTLLGWCQYLPVPPWEDDSAGIKVPFHMVAGLRRNKDTKAILYRRRVFKPIKLRVMDCEILVPLKGRKRIYNPAGLLTSFLHGCVRGSRSNADFSGSIVVRHDHGRFHTTFGTAPNWECTDRVPMGRSTSSQRWNTAVWRNVAR